MVLTIVGKVLAHWKIYKCIVTFKRDVTIQHLQYLFFPGCECNRESPIIKVKLLLTAKTIFKANIRGLILHTKYKLQSMMVQTTGLTS